MPASPNHPKFASAARKAVEISPTPVEKDQGNGTGNEEDTGAGESTIPFFADPSDTTGDTKVRQDMLETLHALIEGLFFETRCGVFGVVPGA